MSIISPWMEKGSAHQYVEDKMVDPRPLIRGIARGLCYLHTHIPGPICHGSLRDGRAVLSDFGLSRLCKSSSNVAHPSSMPEQHHTGSPLNWMAPEILDAVEVSAEADVWAFGMTVLELFTRRNPYQHVSHTVLRARIMEGPPDRPSPKGACSHTTDGLWNISSSCWEHDPKLRPTTSFLVEEIEGYYNASQRFRNAVRTVVLLQRTVRCMCVTNDNEKPKMLAFIQDLFEHQALVRHMQFSPNGKYLATSRCVFQCMPMPFTYIHPIARTGPLSYSRLG
ncbi:hypothetical protein ID866_9498 [Astraeus odoratus]|nr:hypothetical protein ID866_9498 [Astraeus odoratus]